MRITIAGGTGFLGQALAAALTRDGHHLTLLTRHRAAPSAGPTQTVTWTPDGTAGPWAAAVRDADAVINLAGDSIAGGRWTADKKRRILDSRVLATRSLGAALSVGPAGPDLLISSSAVGYYGSCGDEFVTEAHPPGNDFLSRVCVEWEQEAIRAANARARVVLVRTGLVLDAAAGALPRMLPPFRLGAGGPLGSGRQYMPWIHRQDWVDLVRCLLVAPNASGAFNASAPAPVTNAEFARVLGRVLHRPAFLPAPAFVLRLALGEMADALLLSGQRAVPAQAQRIGFAFTYGSLETALQQLLSRERPLGATEPPSLSR